VPQRLTTNPRNARIHGPEQIEQIRASKLTESSRWDEELLGLELGDLQAAGFDLALTGFDQDELDPKYAVIVQQWQEQTGQSATLEQSGRNFSEMASEKMAAA
jgi:hypothetical protein